MKHSAGSTRHLHESENDESTPFLLYGLTHQWFTQSAFGAVVMNLDCRLIQVNPAFCSMLGYEDAQLKQLSMPALVHPDELLRCMHLSSQLAAGAIPSFQTEQRFIHQSGEPVWCSVHTILLHDEQGEPRFLLLQTQNIDDKKRLETMLNTSAHTFNSLLESVPFALIMLKQDWEISYANKAAEDIFKQRREDLTGRSIREIFPEAAGSPIYKELQRAMEEKIYTYIHQYYAPRKHWYEISCHPTKEGICLFLRETTAMKMQENAYLETKLQIASMIDHAPDAVSILDLQYRIVKVNPAYTEIFGFTEDELLGKRPPIIPEELTVETHELFQQAARGRQIVGFETKRLHKNNRMLDVSLTIFPLKNAENLIVALFVTIRDISGDKQMELQLRQSEENYKIITENTHDLIALLSVDGIVKYASPSHQRVLGVSPAVLVGNCPFDYLEEPWKTNVKEFFSALIEEKEPRITEIYWHGPNQEQGKTLEIHGVPVFGQDGNIDKVVIVSRDISERKNTEELLRRSDKLSVAGQLAAGIAHEIRNPLTALKGFTQFMYKGGPHKDQYLSIMMSELTRIEQIISELLMLAKPQAVTYKKRQIEPVLRDVISLLRSQANLNGVQMLLQIHSTIPAVHCEENQLKQVFINLLKNSIEAMPAGGIIRIYAQQSADGKVSIVLQDQGGGIPAEKLSRLGEPFFTTKEKGSGLGLMISQKILNEHGGTLRFNSEPGHGTTAAIILPAAVD
ncbi:MAG: sensor signal transduction histidine kinase [Paenibacillus sp.]|jgi:two-component system sporulation sensor kinase A|nr:sensor signal transduction histidine kinase [Paenibacillus sp.]